MATYDLPAWLRAAAFEWGVRKSGVQFVSPYDATPQSLSFAADRWECGITIPARLWRDAGAPEAFFSRLAGGVHRVRVPHLGRRSGVPQGTLRGLPALASAHAAGVSQLSIAAAAATGNLLVNPGFEVDTDANGRADGWLAHTGGTTGSVTYTTATTYDGARSQRVIAANLGTTGSDFAGLYTITSVAWHAGQPFCFSVYLLGGGGVAFVAVLFLVFRNAAGATLSTASNSISPNFGAYARHTVAGTVPVGAVDVVCYVYAAARVGVAGSSELSMDNAMLEVGVSTPSVYSTVTTLPTVLAGDMLGVSGQLFMAADDATADAGGNMTINITSPVRTALSNSAAVTWQAPTCLMAMPAMGFRSVHVPAMVDAITVDLVEAP